MPPVMSFVICFGVNRGVQMVFRYPPKGIKMDLSCNETPHSDELGVTLGVKTEHLAFLLCPQHIQEVPESDIITVERFSFHVRYFHIENCFIKHLAIVVCMAGEARENVQVCTSFLDGYSAAVNREQNRSEYLQEAAMLLSKRRDVCDEPGGNWTALYNDVASCSLVHEIVSITDAFTEGRKVQLYVNNWLHLESLQPSVTSAKTYDDQFTILMVHSSLRQPLEKATIDQVADIIKGITLPEILSLLAVPVTVADLKHTIEKVIGRSEQPMTLYAEYKQYSLKQVTFNKLLSFLISKKIAKVLKTYYIFQSFVFNDAAMQSMSKRTTRGYAPARTSPPPEGVDAGLAGVKLLTGVKEERRAKSTPMRQQVERHMPFVEMIARNSKMGTVDIIEHLRKVIDLFDGSTPKEEILARAHITSDDLEEVLTVFHEFITTVVA